MLFNTICWIMIGICCFYLIRNVYVGSIMFPAGKHIVMIYNHAVGKSYLHELGTDADVLRGSWRGVKYRQMYFLWQRGWSDCDDASISGVK